MATKKTKKKEVETTTWTPVDVDKSVDVPAAESLIPVRAKRAFQDGVFSKEFSKYGYKPYWQEGEIRKIPEWLFQKLMMRSGGHFEKFK